MSKSVSLGVTCACTIIVGPSQSTFYLLKEDKDTVSIFDNGAREDLIIIFCKNHISVNETYQKPYAVTRAVQNDV